MNAPEFSLKRIKAGEYLGWTDDQRGVFLLRSYIEDGTATDPYSGRQITGTRWEALALAKDLLADGYPLLQRDADGKIAHVDGSFLDEGEWEVAIHSCRSRREAWDHARTRKAPVPK